MTSKDLISSARDEEPLVRIGDGAVDRMPGLSVIFDDVAARFEKFVGAYAEAASVAVEPFQAQRLCDLAERHADFGRLYAFRVPDGDFRTAIVVDGVFRSLVFELLLGSGVIDVDPTRPATRIEDRVVAFVAQTLVNHLGQSFAALGKVSFLRDIVAEEAGFFALGAKGSVILHARMTLRVGVHEALVLLALPRSALDPYRIALARLPDPNGRAADEKWSEKLYNNLVLTEVKAEVRIEARGFTLGDIARLEVGDVLRLPIAPTDPIRVVSENRTLFWCTLGQRDGMYTVRLEAFSDERESRIETILGV